MHEPPVWRIIPLETNTAAMNMAIDEAIREEVARGTSPPTIRFYQWNPSAVSIGYFQSLQDEVAMDACQAQRVDVVRRQTGGGAVYHDFQGEITYSVIAPEVLFPRGIIESLNLRRPIYKKTAAYGHFGRDDEDFTWEKTDKADILRREAGI